MSDQAIEQSVEERMMALLGDPEPQDEVVEDDPQAEVETEEVEASEEDQPEQRTFKLKRGEEEIEAPEAEVIELAQKGYDYTKKTQELADKSRNVEAQLERVQQQEIQVAEQAKIQHQFISDIAAITAIDNQLAQFQSVDWQQLSSQDPVEAQKLFFTYNQLQVQRTQAANTLQTKRQQYAATVEQQRAKQLSEGAERLKKAIPDWSDEKAREIRKLGKDYGFTDTELSGITDARAVHILHDAIQYRKLQQSKPTIDNKVANKPPVVKPGGKDAKIVANTKYSADRAQLRKTGDGELAAKLIEQML